ncbi:MAG: beta-ketoacyl synthase N-terminal-like domain-containing protein [Planctomycetota bacterium]
MPASYEPIAIVGRGCVLPGALSPAALFASVRAARVAIAPAPARAWGLDAQRLLAAAPPGPETEYAVSDRGGYVTGFDEVFDPSRYADAIVAPDRLDPLVQWLLHCADRALEEAGIATAPPGTGAIIGNLSYPTVAHGRFVEDYWLGAGDGAPLPGRVGTTSDPRNRFSSGYPVHLVAQAFGLTGDSFALDAACASSLYAIDLACRRLHDREADLMLAGGIARADPLIIHLGFTALQALSPSGQSRPLHRGADGLLPAEGAGLVALKRLSDAVRDGDHVFGLIRAVGLSNDGRQSGFLAPSLDGQVKAMRSAYAQADLTPGEISYVECHATGTPLGDRIELESLAAIWGDGPKPVIGSIKANIGHPITASGVASLFKVLSAFDANELPPTPCDAPVAAIAEHGFRLLQEVEPWPSRGPRRAAISNFGFGGNNAHLIVEEWPSDAKTRHMHAVAPTTTAAAAADDDVVIAAIGVIAGESVGLPAFVRRLTAARDTSSTRTEEIALPMQRLGFPPNDLRHAFAQQTSILAVVEEALAQAPPLDPDRTGVYVGMCVDPCAARHGLRVRLRDLLGDHVDAAAWRRTNAEAAESLTAAGVIGCMPNIPANRVHAQQDWRAPGFTIASEELSGTDALALAVRALRASDIDAAVVAASDFSHEDAHLAAVVATLPADRQRPGDAAVALVLMRAADAERTSSPVLAKLTGRPTALDDAAVSIQLAPEAGESEVTARFGHAHGASGLLHVAAGAVASHLGVTIDRAGAWPAPRRPDRAHTVVRATSFSGRSSSVALAAPATPRSVGGALAAPVVQIYAATSREGLVAALEAGTQGNAGTTRLALIGADEATVEEVRRFAHQELQSDRVPNAPGLYYGEGELHGEVAFAYTGAAAAYPGAARDLLMAFPEIGHQLVHRCSGIPQLARDLYGADVTELAPAAQLNGSSFVCQAHTELTRSVLGIRPEVSLGLSSGETNSLMAFGVWNDLDEMVAEIEASEMYANQLTGDCQAAGAYWSLPKGEVPRWRCWRIAAPLAAIEASIENEPRVYVTVIHHYEDVVIGGDAAACDRVVDAIGRQRAIPLGLDMVVHCAPLEPFADTWHSIHVRDTRAVPDIRFYTNAGNRAYVPTREAAAAAITQQALEPIDFPKTVEQAYADGVRVFIEHGPRAIVTGAIARILEGRPHVVAALDPHEGAGLEPLARSVGKLWAAGVPMSIGPFIDRLAALRSDAQRKTRGDGPELRLRVHPPEVVWRMAPAAPVHEPDNQREFTMPSHPHTNGVGHDAATTASTMAAPPAAPLGYDVSGLFATGPANGTPPPAAPAPLAPAAAIHAGLVDPAVEYFRRVAAAHVEFLAQQKELQDTFLGLGSLAGVAAAPALPAVPAAPAMAPRPTNGTAAPNRHVAITGAPATPPNPTAEPPVAPSAPAARPAPVTRAPARSAMTTPDSPLAPPQPGPTPNLPAPGTVWLNRAQLETHASGVISEIFGERFKQQDGYARQVRMPEPPLLFADRALTVEGEPGSMQKGRVVTETDVQPEAWYLHAGRMAPGVVIESGQADLLLISWLGADVLNRDERVYRLLGCDLTFYGELPAPGDTLTYDIYVDGHAKTGDVRLFFFHYDCRVGDRLLISVRNGQAGFFTDEELADSGGVLWDAADDTPKPAARLDPAPQLTKKRAFTAADVKALVGGDAYRCFGAGFEPAAPHTRTPGLPAGRLQLLDSVPTFEPGGGPWGRGYLKAAAHVPVDAWFYDGHFKNDPCMPGTLMADAATQALAFTMAAMGFTILRDGWRFEPVAGEMARFVCRGQVVPDGPHDLEYEVFVEEVIDGDCPEIYAALLCTSDGFKVFGCRRFGLRLVPDDPLVTPPAADEASAARRSVGPPPGVPGDYDALLACALGKPSDAFGPMFAKYDGPLKCPRLPAPPYHFVSSIVSVDVAAGSGSDHGTLVSTFEIDPDAWYFAEGDGTMPFAVLAESFLQPCGWFASYLNLFADAEGDVAFRNLDGDCVIHQLVRPDTGTLTLTTRLQRIAKAASTSLVFLDVEAACASGPVATVTTSFGFFSPEVLKAQKGLPTTDEERARRDAPSPVPPIPLLAGGGPLAHLPGMASGQMRMLDEVTGFWEDGGKAQLGRLRTRQTIQPEAWYFKAHFYEDPVQPGSLGLEALIQASRALLSLKGWLAGIPNPVWEQPVIGSKLAWRYRGQVVPTNDAVVTEIEVLEADVVDGELVTLQVYGTQWVDGLRIYEVPAFAVRVRAGRP